MLSSNIYYYLSIFMVNSLKEEVMMTEKKKPAMREVFSTRVDPELIKQLKHLAVDEKKAINELLEEAIRMLLVDRGNKS
jgi:hypothetical protein